MNTSPQHPFLAEQLTQLAETYGTPVWLYDAPTIRARIAQLSAFDVVRFAQKACSNTHILKLMRTQSVKVDAVSYGEIIRAQTAGYLADEIVFTCDVLDIDSCEKVVNDGIAVNVGSIDMLRQLATESARVGKTGHPVWIRINPGFGHGHSQKTNTGGENSKHGIWHQDLPLALALIDTLGLTLIGLHMHIGSGVDYAHLSSVCSAMVTLIKESGANVQAISAGGGLSTPYQAGQERVDIAHYFSLWDAARLEIAAHLGHPVTLEIEPGRFLVAESGVLLSRVRSIKNMGAHQFVLVNAGFNDLMRPALYGSYHHISVLPHALSPSLSERETAAVVVGGPLCESGDVFTQQEGGFVAQRPLPQPVIDDLLVFHDTGAYGASMSSNYNSRPFSPEVLIDGKHTQLIRRRQTIAELLALEDTL